MSAVETLFVEFCLKAVTFNAAEYAKVKTWLDGVEAGEFRKPVPPILIEAIEKVMVNSLALGLRHGVQKILDEEKKDAS